MIIDTHTRIWDSPSTLGAQVDEYLRRQKRLPWQELATGTEAFDEAMGPVSHAILHGFESSLLGASISADTVAEHVRRSPQRYLGFVGIDPTQPGAPGKLEHAAELGLVGLTVSPSGQGFHPLHSDAMALYEACQERGWPVYVEPMGSMAREARIEFDQPQLLDEVARTCPDLRIVLGALAEPFVDQALAMLAKHPNVFADVGGLIRRPWRLYNALVGAYERGVTAQLLFSSGYPFATPEQAIVTLYSLNSMTQGTQLPSLPREQMRAIVERDTFRALGLPDRESAEPLRPIQPRALSQGHGGPSAFTVIREAAG